MTIQPSFSRVPQTTAAARRPPQNLQDLYDCRQEDLQAAESKAERLEHKGAEAQRWTLRGMVTLFTGQGTLAASALLKPVVSSAVRSGLLGTGIGLTAVGLAVFCPALWIRDTAQMDATFARIDASCLRESMSDLKAELEKKPENKPAS